MVWPRRLFAATLAAGVFYADNFVDPSTQPVWTAINTGLAALDCREFALDPFDQAGRQYVLLEASRALYRRESGGSWASILTSAQIAAIVGEAATMVGFCVDAATDGRVWSLVQSAAFWGPIWALRSDDYGATWAATVVQAGNYTYGAYGIRAYGTRVYARVNCTGGALAHVHYSTDTGATWAATYIDWSAENPMWLNPLTPDGVYAMEDDTGNQDLCRVTNIGGNTMLQDGLSPGRWDAMWFDPTIANHQRLFRGGYLYATADGWATINSPSVISPTPVSFAPWAGVDTDQMLVGLGIVGGTPPTQPHVIGALYGEDIAATGIAGASAGNSPYTDSIPATCGGLAVGGIAAVDAVGIVHTYAVAMPGYTGADRGTPMEGDRASWETGVTHADDWATGNSHHAVVTVGTDAAVLLELSSQELQLKAQAANTVLAGPASGAATDPTFRALASDDLPAHTHTESQITDLDHTDPDAFHDDVSGEIHAVTAKTSLVDADVVLIEDSGASWAKRRVALSDLLAGTGAVMPVFSQVVDVVVANTTDETSLLGSGRGAKTLTASLLVQGSTIVVAGHGYLSTTGTPTLTIKMTLGGTEVCTTGAVTMNSSVSGVGFTFRIEIVCRSTGASGSVVAGGTFEYDDDSEHKLFKASATAADTTTALAVDVTATWGTADAGNSVTCQVATIELIKANELAVAAPGDLTAVEV